ncbi:MAG: Acb2/Tad1 domain-containing protein [Polyangiales bacterium]
MSQSDFDPEYVFSHHHATPEKLAKYQAIHNGAKELARVFLEQVPSCSDRAAALRLLREASMLACAAVTLDGRLR